MQQLVGASSSELTSPLCSLSAVLVAASPPISECRRTKKDLKKKNFFGNVTDPESAGFAWYRNDSGLCKFWFQEKLSFRSNFPKQ
jgi:hypothetical protein